MLGSCARLAGAWLLLTPPQGLAERVVRVELAGAPARVEHTTEREGRVYLWALAAELDPTLAAFDADGRALGSDDDSGGGHTPYLELALAAGTRLTFVVDAKDGGEGSLELHLVEASEGANAREAAARANEALDAALADARAGRVDAAREALAVALAALAEERESVSSEALSRAAWRLAGTGEKLGLVREALRARELALAQALATRPPDHPDLLYLRRQLAVAALRAGETARALELQEAALASAERSLPDDDLELARARHDLGSTLARTGELERAVALLEHALEGYAGVGSDAEGLARVRIDLSLALRTRGELERARELQEQALSELAATRPEDDPLVQTARLALANTLRAQGDLVGADRIFAEVLAQREAQLPPDHPGIQTVKGNLATTRRELGDLASARRLTEEALAALERQLPPGHPELARARMNLAGLRRSQGDLEGVREMQEQVLEELTLALGPDHPDRLGAAQNLADVLLELGELPRAREVAEELVARARATLPEDDPRVASAVLVLAKVRSAFGDVEGARVLLEGALSGAEASLPDGHPEVQRLRAALADALAEDERHEQARALRERIVVALEPIRAPDDLELLAARGNLAGSLLRLDEVEAARELAEEDLRRIEGRERTRPRDVWAARRTLAAVLAESGALAEARAHLELAVSGMEAELPASDLELFRARVQLLDVVARVGDEPTRAALAARLAEDVQEQALERALPLSPREAEMLAASLRLVVNVVLEHSDPVSDAGRDLALVESLRAIALRARRAREALTHTGETGRELQLALRAASAELVRLLAGDPESERLREARERREACERALAAALVDHEHSAAPAASAASIAAHLAADEAGVSYVRRIAGAGRISGRAQGASEERARYTAFVVRPDASVVRVELGPAREVEALVGAWRTALGAEISAPELERGRAPRAAEHEGGELASGVALRERVIDPVLAAAGGVRRLVVALDRALHFVPLDALPEPAHGPEARLGDRVALSLLPLLLELSEPARASSSSRTLLAVGGIDYGAPPEATFAASRALLPRAAFGPLPATLTEVEEIAALAGESAPPESCLVLAGSEATKQAVLEALPGTRFLHLATHGFFAAQVALDDAQKGASLSLRERVTRLSPLLLSGLALAGANSGDGVLSAEELSVQDLSSCELAVLSACETRAGRLADGQGIASLQKALHLAGARRSLTSLWEVGDDPTRALMIGFYRRLWVDGMPTERALWAAKSALRAARAPGGLPRYATREWAGWVLTGAPD